MNKFNKVQITTKKIIFGVVLWWDEHDGNGIIKDVNGSKYYFDSSVISQKNIKSGLNVQFERNSEIKDCVCAYKVKIVNS